MYHVGKWRDCRFRVGVLTLTSVSFWVYNFAKFWKKLEGWDKANSEATQLGLHLSPAGVQQRHTQPILVLLQLIL